MARSLGGGYSGNGLWIAARAYRCSDCVRVHLPRCRDDYRLCGPFRGSEAEAQMICGTNERPGADAGWRVLFAFQRAWPRVAQAER